MVEYFDHERWAEVLRRPDWYLVLNDELKVLRQRAEEASPEEARLIKDNFKDFIADRIRLGGIALAATGPNLDDARQPIDTIVIHHTSQSRPYSLEHLNVTHLLNLYATYYADPHIPEEGHLKGQSIWSNHFYKDKQVFFAYHWFVRMDGTYERLLDDDKIGWQSGNWDVNCRSVGICLDGDFTDSTPNDVVITALADLIKTYYPRVEHQYILGHQEVNPKTICPGNEFLEGWKCNLLELMS